MDFFQIPVNQIAAKKAKRRDKKIQETRKYNLPGSLEFSQESPQDFFNLRIYPPHNITFNIFPRGTFPQKIEVLLAFMKGISVKDQLLYTSSLFKFPIKDKNMKNVFEESMNKFWGGKVSATATIILKLYIKKINTLRWQFRKFLHRWRTSRLRMINTEDFCTLEVPKDPVYIVDWASQSKSVFESSSLMRDITTRLLHCDGFFDCPQQPRNPYTNLPLTQAQIISVWTQLAFAKTAASAVFTEFRKSRWSLYTFSIEYSVPLQLHAFRTTMRNPLHQDFKEKMIDFILYCHDEEDADCRSSLYEYAIKFNPSHPLIKKWQELCIQFHEAPIMYGKMQHKIIIIQDDVLKRSVSLLRRFKELESI